MSVTRIHEHQGSLLDGFPPEEPAEEPGVQVELAQRALYLHRTLGHLAYLSQTTNYENIDDSDLRWFKAKIYRQHPQDYRQHVDDRLQIRAIRAAEAVTDFGIAFGVNEMIESGSMSAEEANQWVKDLYEGTDKSGLNPDGESFKLSYAGSGKNTDLNALRKKLEKQSPKLKK